MRRLLALLAPLLAAAAPATVVAAPAVPELGATLSACDRSGASFVGAMPALAGTERMEMRFELEVRRPGGAWRRAFAPTFGTWERSEPGRAGFVYEKRVERLQPDRLYRVKVRFRWFGPGGVLQRRARRVSASCRSASRPAWTPGTPR